MKRTCPKCGAELLIAGLVVPVPPIYGGAAPQKSFACHGCGTAVVVTADEPRPVADRPPESPGASPPAGEV